MILRILALHNSCHMRRNLNHSVVLGATNNRNNIIMIIRIKNGFSEISDKCWELPLSSINYCDIKINVRIASVLIGEMQKEWDIWNLFIC